MTVLQLMRDLHVVCYFQSIEKGGIATNSEIGRWIKNKSVVVNGNRANLNDEIESVESLVLFPKSVRKITLK